MKDDRTGVASTGKRIAAPAPTSRRARPRPKHEGVDGITRPGLVLWGRDDPFAAVWFAERLARRLNAELPSLLQLRSLVAFAATGRGRAITGAIMGDADVMRIAQN